MGDDDESKPLSEVLSLLDGCGLKISEDGLQRLRKAGLVDAKGPIITLDQAKRLKEVLVIRNRIGSKWRLDQLAFFMVMHGMERVPAKLVGDYIEFLVDDYTRIVERILRRLGSGTVAMKRRRVASEEAMAGVIVRGMYRNMVLPRTPELVATRSALEAWVAVVLAVVFCKKRVSDIPNLVRRAVFLAITDPTVAEQQLEDIRSFLERTLPALTISDTNALLQDVRRAKKTPLVMLTAARDAAHIVRLLNRALAPIPAPQPGVSSKTNVEIFERLYRSFLGLLAGLSIQSQANPNSARFLARLRAGDDFGLSVYLSELYRDSVTELERARTVS